MNGPKNYAESGGSVEADVERQMEVLKLSVPASCPVCLKPRLQRGEIHDQDRGTFRLCEHPIHRFDGAFLDHWQALTNFTDRIGEERDRALEAERTLDEVRRGWQSQTAEWAEHRAAWHKVNRQLISERDEAVRKRDLEGEQWKAGYEKQSARIHCLEGRVGALEAALREMLPIIDATGGTGLPLSVVTEAKRLEAPSLSPLMKGMEER